ncbi:fimbrillin family protein [Bacteroides reticulotermitis]|uniref:fimbrillin family protein n=1 Tax=Bacteroides reticulotermitis TaxID=1133319 RepID=UPI003A8C7B59
MHITIKSNAIQIMVCMLFILGVASCETKEMEFEQPYNAIDFGSVTDIFTRGSEVKKNTMQADPAGYGVLAYHARTNWAADGYTHTPDFMNRTQVIYADPKWGYTPLKYWYASGTLSFFAYYPYDLLTENYTATGIPQFQYTVPDNPAHQKDILAASAIDKTKESGKVKFDFKHLLSRVSFQAKTGAEYSVPVKITEVKLNYVPGKIRSKGTFTYTTNANAAGYWLLDNKYLSGTFPVYNPSEGIVLTKNLQSITNSGSELYILPQNVSQGDMTLTVTYKIGNGPVEEKTVPLFPVSGYYLLDKGKHYQVNITVTLNGVEFDDITVSDYTEMSYYTLTYKQRKNSQSNEYVTIGTERIYGNHQIKTKNIPIQEVDNEYRLLKGWAIGENSANIAYLPGAEITLTHNTTLHAVNLIVARGNLIPGEEFQAKIGDPSYRGALFQFGSLVGWNITGEAPSIVIKPGEGYTGSTTWQSGWRGNPDAFEPNDTNAGLGDPCWYYLGGDWRLPKREELITIMSGVSDNILPWSSVDGWDWLSNPQAAQHTSGMLLRASGRRLADDGSLLYVDEIGTYWSSHIYGETTGFSMSVKENGLSINESSYRANAFPVRCVRVVPSDINTP